MQTEGAMNLIYILEQVIPMSAYKWEACGSLIKGRPSLIASCVVPSSTLWLIACACSQLWFVSGD